MPTRAEIIAAVQRAHDAGDTEGARKIAGMMSTASDNAPEAPVEAKPEVDAYHEITGGMQNAYDKAALGVKQLLPQSIQDLGDKVDQATGFGKLEDQVARGNKFVKDTSKLSDVGGIAGSMLLQAPTAGAKLAMAPMMATNALYNWVTTPNEENRNLAAGLGGVAAPIAKGLTAAVKGPLKNLMTGEAKILTDEGATLTPGQMLSGDASSATGRFVRDLEDRAQSIPILGDIIKNARTRATKDYNKLELNDALAPIGKELKIVGQNGLDQARSHVDDVITRNIPNISILPSVARPTIARAVAQAQADPLFDVGHAARLNKIIGVKLDDLISGNKVIDGNTANEIYKTLGVMASRITKEEDAPLKSAIREIQQAWGSSMQGTTRTATQDILNANQAAQNLLKLEHAADKNPSALFNPRQVQQGAKASRTADADLAKIARPVLEDRVPDSGTASRLGLASLAKWGLTGGAAATNPAAAAAITAGTAGAYSRPFLNYLAKGLPGNSKLSDEELQRALNLLSNAGMKDVKE